MSPHVTFLPNKAIPTLWHQEKCKSLKGQSSIPMRSGLYHRNISESFRKRRGGEIRMVPIEEIDLSGPLPPWAWFYVAYST